MPTVKRFESNVWRIECFEISIKQNGSNVRSDRMLTNTYSGNQMSRNKWTVNEWKNKKFTPLLEGYDVDVLYKNGDPAPGNTTLMTVRDSYND